MVESEPKSTDGWYQLSRVLSSIGLTHDRHVVAYNDDNGSHAARLLWTLDVVGHGGFSLLNGGFAAWDERDLPVQSEPGYATPTEYRAVVQTHKYADFDYVMEKIGDSDTVLLDTRSPEEYHGIQVRADRGGHIPGNHSLLPDPSPVGPHQLCS